MIKHLIIVEDELGNRRMVKPGPVILGPTEVAIGIEATKEWKAARRGFNNEYWKNYKFRMCSTCKELGVYEYT